MASRTTTQGNEKRSGNPTRSSRSASKHSIDKEKEKPEKPLPNYLKPTISSRNESFKLVQKDNTHEQNQKYLRRRSFDSRQLPSSSSQKPLISPARRDSIGIGPVLRERKITVRSTSYSSRTNSSASKLVLDHSGSTTSSRTTKGAAVKSQPLPSRSAKRSATSSTNNKKEHNVSPSVDDVGSSHTLKNETKEEENESEVHEVEEVVKAEREVDVQSDVPKPETVEDVVDDIPRETEVKNNDEDDEKIKSCDISTVSESENVVQPAAPSLIEETAHEEEKSNEVDDVPQQETSKEEARELEESTGNSTTLPEEKIVEEAKTEVEDQKVVDDNENNKTEDQLESTDEEAVGDQEKEVVEEKEQQDEVEESEEVKAKEEKEQEQQVLQEANNDDEDEKTKTKQQNAPANLAITSMRQEHGQGRKESPTAYNDVIEETASRLLEKRKNKVRALVGAFETVIDYESASSTPKGNN